MPAASNSPAGKNLPPFAALRAFEALASAGSVRKAAKTLGLHHSVVSRHIALLEAWLGTPLVKWSGRQLSLTESGQTYYQRISSAIAEIALATRDVMGTEAGRPLRIWCSPGLSIQWLASQIAEFEALHVGVRVELKPSENPADLLRHEADANIYFHLDGSSDDLPGKGLKAQQLTRPNGMVAASPDLACSLPDIRSAADLLELPLLHGNQKDDWRFWFLLNGVAVTTELPGEMCWHPNMALEAARLGRGILLANKFFLDRDLARGDLVEIRVPDASKSFGVYLFTAREDRWSVPTIAALRRFLTERMQNM